MRTTFSDWALPAMILPQGVALAVLLSVARSPVELFQDAAKPKKAAPVIEVALEEKKEEAPPPLPPLPGLADSLAPDPSASGGGLESLTAGVVSEGAGAGGVAMQQGEVRAEALVQEGSQEDRAPKLSRSSNPVYPSTAQNQGVEGYVLLHVQVLANGSVGELKVLEGKPAGMFEAAAKRAVSSWKYTPGLEKGRPAVMWVKHKVNFALD
jgi:protein TonB